MKHNKQSPWQKSPEPSAVANPGPVTAEGKEISSRNALKHGCSSNGTLVLPTEDPQAFKALEATWFRAYQPKDSAETHLVHQLVESDWFLQRATKAYANKEAQLYSEIPDSSKWTEDQHKSLGRFLRYRTTHTNAVIKQRKAIEDYRRKRQQEQSRDQAMRHKDERLAIAKAKAEILRKNQDSGTIEQELDRWLEAKREANHGNKVPFAGIFRSAKTSTP